METITNVTNAASRAIWGENSTNAPTATGESGTEPISGETGGKGEPFDAGNADENPTSTIEDSSPEGPKATETTAEPTLGATKTAVHEETSDVIPTTTAETAPKVATAENPVDTPSEPVKEKTIVPETSKTPGLSVDGANFHTTKPPTSETSSMVGPKGERLPSCQLQAQKLRTAGK